MFGCGRFLDELDAFERTRQGTARIEGTYDFSMSIGAHQTRGDALVRFSITRLLTTSEVVGGRCTLEADFIVNGENVAAMLTGFRRVFAR